MTLPAIGTSAGAQCANQIDCRPATPWPHPVMPETATLTAIVAGETVAVWPSSEVASYVTYWGDQPPTLIGSGLTPKAQQCFGVSGARWRR